MLYPHLYINGEIVSRDKAFIPIYDLGLLRGLGIFDFFRVVDGVAIFAEDHIDRLEHSLDLIGLQVPMSKMDWLNSFYDLIRINGAQTAGFRIVVTGGYSEDGYSIPAEKNVYMMLHELPANDPAQYENGVKLITSVYQREWAEAKTTIYVQSMRLQPEVKKAGAYEILYHRDGMITECSRCNVFFIDTDGVLHTPERGMLKGITRKHILALAKENDIQVVERPVHFDEISKMAGAFLTATTKGALPVTRIDDLVIGNGKVHPLAMKLDALYRESVEKYITSVRLAQAVM